MPVPCCRLHDFLVAPTGFASLSPRHELQHLAGETAGWFTEARREPTLEDLLIAARPGSSSSSWTGPAPAPTPWARSSTNLAGREPRGSVAPGAEYESVRKGIIDGLRLMDPQTGEHPVLRVCREMYRGFDPALLPDLRAANNLNCVGWQTALGEVLEHRRGQPESLERRSLTVDPSLVPGILFPAEAFPAVTRYQTSYSGSNLGLPAEGIVGGASGLRVAPGLFWRRAYSRVPHGPRTAIATNPLRQEAGGSGRNGSTAVDPGKTRLDTRVSWELQRMDLELAHRRQIVIWAGSYRRARARPSRLLKVEESRRRLKRAGRSRGTHRAVPRGRCSSSAPAADHGESGGGCQRLPMASRAALSDRGADRRYQPRVRGASAERVEARKSALTQLRLRNVQRGELEPLRNSARGCRDCGRRHRIRKAPWRRWRKPKRHRAPANSRS